MKKWLTATIAVVVVVIVVFSVLYIGGYISPKKGATANPLVYSSTRVALTGQNVSFSMTNVSGTINSVTWNFGDGQTGTGTNTNHSYSYPGNYLVQVTYKSGGNTETNVANLYPVSVNRNAASYNSTTLSEMTTPIVLFNKTINPTAPIFNTSANINATAGYFEPPSAKYWAITGYNWTFGGKTSTNSTFNTSSSTNGLAYIMLNITTSGNSSSHQNTFIESVYVHASGSRGGVLTGSGSVVNPGTITNAEVVPGGPYSLDPQIDWETVGMEVLRNTYQTLVAFNGTSTTSFIPVLVTNIPTVANGGISSNNLNWTFTIRSNATFADGNTLTAFDVYFSMVRELLFTNGNPGTGGYTLAQAVLPGYASKTPHYNDYANITTAITYSNSSNTVTFHLFSPVPYFMDLLADTPSSVMEYSWAAAHGAGLTFTSAGFNAYMSEANAANYAGYLQNHTMGTGPFTVALVQPGESITMVPNSHYHAPAYGFPKSNYTIVIDYVKEATSATLLLQDGEADIVSNLPTSSLPSVQTLVSKGEANTYTFSTMTTYFYPFNFNINTTMLHSMSSTYTIPAHYFANLYVRKAFVEAFNYSQFLSDIVGNVKYKTTLGSPYVGLLVGGMLGYKPYSDWQNVPTYDLVQAKQYMAESGVQSTKVNFPIFVQSGDTTNYAGISMWISAIESIDSNITITPVYITFSQMIGYTAKNANPMPIYDLGWGTSIPDPINMIPPMYVAGGFYPSGDGINTSSDLTTLGYPQQAQNFSKLGTLADEAATNPNSTQRAAEYQQANQIGINLTMYLYTYIPSGLWIYKNWLSGVQYQENPVVGGEVDTLYCYLSK